MDTEASTIRFTNRESYATKEGNDMDMNSISNTTTAVSSYTSKTASKAATEKAAEKTPAPKKDNSGVVYDRNSSTKNTEYTKVNAGLIKQLKADSDARLSQLKGIVEKMMTQQGSAVGKADDMWKFLAGGNFTVTPEVKAQAQADIADDGYWGVDQTSDRIVDFAKALSGGNSEKAGKLLDAFKKGFEEATKSWGKTLPDISKRTYDSVLEKFQKWTDGDKAEAAE